MKDLFTKEAINVYKLLYKIVYKMYCLIAISTVCLYYLHLISCIFVHYHMSLPESNFQYMRMNGFKNCGLMFVVFHMSFQSTAQNMYVFPLVYCPHISQCAVNMGCCCLSGALPVRWGITCLDKCQVFSRTNYSSVKMLTFQCNFVWPCN